MSRITACMAQLKSDNRSALIPYITAGDPQPSVTVPLMHAMVEAGADIIELGVPFSDPMADGPVIQRASERALEHKVALHHVLDMVREFRDRNDTTPVVLMGYLNPVEVMGYSAFAQHAKDAGVDGVLTVDLPPEEAHDLVVALKDNGLDPIFLLAPTTDDARIQKICAVASGYVYYVSLKGVTGSSQLDSGAVERKLQQIRQFTQLPIGVGFGIKDADSASAIARIADAVVVGSALIQKVEQYAQQQDKIGPTVCALLAAMRQAMDQAR